jgi:hypothetical protein
MATLADVTTQWQTQAQTDLDKAIADATLAKKATDDASKAAKDKQEKVAKLATDELSLLARLDDAPSPADLEELKNQLTNVRRNLRKERAALASLALEADHKNRAAVRAQTAVARAREALATATAAANDAADLKANADRLTKATQDPPVKWVDERATAAQADQLVKATTHIQDQIGEHLLTLAHAQAAAVRAETEAALARLDGARRAQAIVGDENDARAVLLAALDALGTYTGTAVARLDAAIARLEAVTSSPKSSQEAITAVHDAVDAGATSRFADERNAAAALAAADATRTVAEWRYNALVISTGDPDDDAVTEAKEALDKASTKRDEAADDHSEKADAITDEDKQAREAWNDAVPITLWPLLTDLVEASHAVAELADLDPASLVTTVTDADSAAADAVTARLSRSNAVQKVGLDLDSRVDDVAATTASQPARLAAALSA